MSSLDGAYRIRTCFSTYVSVDDNGRYIHVINSDSAAIIHFRTEKPLDGDDNGVTSLLHVSLHDITTDNRNRALITDGRCLRRCNGRETETRFICAVLRRDVRVQSTSRHVDADVTLQAPTGFLSAKESGRLTAGVAKASRNERFTVEAMRNSDGRSETAPTKTFSDGVQRLIALSSAYDNSESALRRRLEQVSDDVAASLVTTPIRFDGCDVGAPTAIALTDIHDAAKRMPQRPMTWKQTTFTAQNVIAASPALRRALHNRPQQPTTAETTRISVRRSADINVPSDEEVSADGDDGSTWTPYDHQLPVSIQQLFDMS